MKSLPRSIQPVADFCFKHLPCSAVAEIGEVSAGRRGLNAPIYRGFVSFNPSPRNWRPSVSPLFCWRNTEEKCRYSSFPFGLSVVGGTFKLLLCVPRKGNIGEVSLSDGGV